MEMDGEFHFLEIFMEIVAPQPLQSLHPKNQCLMSTPCYVKLVPPLLLRLTPAAFRLFATTTIVTSPESTTSDLQVAKFPEISTPKLTPPNGRRRVSSVRDKKVALDVCELKLNWLESLSCPLPESWRRGVAEGLGVGNVGSGSDSDWVIGVDPDLSGALAVLKPDDSAEVFDSPHLKVPVGKRVRKRLDVKSIIELLRSIDAPSGTTVYLEQSIPFPKDGKQGWWCGGFGYGLWIGILVASGYSVVPVPSFLWKNEFKLAGNRSNKDDSRELASTLFPPLSSLFKRKKDHGRAEALLIAAYGKGLKVDNHTSQIVEDSPS